MGKYLVFIFMTFSLGTGALAQTLIPATSDDLSDFDRQIAQQVQKRLESQRTAQKDLSGKAFSTAVSDEAKLLKGATATTKKKSGKGIQLDVRDRGSQSTVGSTASATASSGGKDAKVSSPVNNSRGNSANAPGKNK